jgi:hypothetical protein
MAGRYVADAFDPEGARHGLPTWPWRMAPDGLATLRQLRADGLRPGGQPIAGQIMWRRYGQLKVAYLYRVDLAKPRRVPSPAQLAAIDAALRARQHCPSCDRHVGYFIPRRYGECLDCHDTWRDRITAAA